MALLHGGTDMAVTDVLDHVLDKGIVFDAWERVSRAGIELISSNVRLVVQSIQTRLVHESPMVLSEPVSPAVNGKPRRGRGRRQRKHRRRK